jgi:hypothetical protein
MIFMGVMLEKWPNKDQEYLKYMFNVRLAASRGSGTGWAESTLGVAFLALRGFPPFEVCKKGLVIAL